MTECWLCGKRCIRSVFVKEDDGSWTLVFVHSKGLRRFCSYCNYFEAMKVALQWGFV